MKYNHQSSLRSCRILELIYLCLCDYIFVLKTICPNFQVAIDETTYSFLRKPTSNLEHKVSQIDAVTEFGSKLNRRNLAVTLALLLLTLNTHISGSFRYGMVKTFTKCLSFIFLQWCCQNSNWPVKSNGFRRVPNICLLLKKERIKVKCWSLLCIVHMP